MEKNKLQQENDLLEIYDKCVFDELIETYEGYQEYAKDIFTVDGVRVA